MARRHSTVLWAERSAEGTSTSDSTRAEDTRKKAAKEIKLPKTGYLSLADPKQPIYSKSTEPFDPAKRGGRYKSEFIWNTNWQETLQRDEQLQRQRREYVERQHSGQATAEEEAGTVDLGLLSNLNRMDVDLSAVLHKRKEPTVPLSAARQQSQLGSDMFGAEAGPRPTRLQQARAQAAGAPPLSRGNAMKLQRSGRLTRDGRTLASAKSEDEAERARLVAAEAKKYEARKLDFQVWTLALTVLGSATTYSLYSTDVSASYLVGSLGGYFYLRLLGKSVDAVGGSTLEGSVGGMASQPRLLIPVIMALAYNRWNTLFAEQSGITLQLLPMLIGFFTYKIAVLARESQELLADLSPKSKEAAVGQDD